MAVALDRSGERFTDEAESGLEETLAQDTAKIAGGRAYYVLDRDVYEAESLAGPAGASIDAAREFDGRVAEAESLDALGERLASWGVDGRQAVATIEAFNDAVESGDTHRLDPPRTGEHHTIDTPPFYAVEVQPGITFTMGGVDVDGEMRVLRRTRTTATFDSSYAPADQREILETPIERLYAAGVDVGNVSHRTYMGGLAQCLVTGRIAGENAAEHA
jgi:succinate dehydrogenase/fumarate reductase flavoprotein subunit